MILHCEVAPYGFTTGKTDFEFQAKCIVLTYLHYDGLVIK
jgi:hypothetical protein